MRMRHLAAPLCLAGLISSTTGALAAPAEVLAAVNLRTGPGAQFYAIGVLPPGAPVEVYGCLNDSDWCDVGYGNMRGWLASRYLGAVGNWSPEEQIMRPPVFSPPPIYREPPVYANPPPVYRKPDWNSQEVYPGDIYIEPPPVYVYRPPVTVGPPMPELPQPNVGLYRAKPRPQTVPSVTAPPPVATSTPPATPAPTAPSVSVTQPSPPTTPPATSPGPSVANSGQPAAAAPPPATETKPKYGGAVGKPGAPCKWVNGVCRND
ncbi:MAG: type 3 domain protein [Proteobacteria bacterium]|nr:type 3 domain protein [Pseudomonadota bacterium]